MSVTCKAQSLACVFIIIFVVYIAPPPSLYRYYTRKGAGDVNTRMIIKTVASDCDVKIALLDVFYMKMMTSSNRSIFRVTGPVTGEFPSQRPATRSFDVFFDLRLNKPLSKQSRGWWFETPSRSSLRHCNDIYINWLSIGWNMGQTRMRKKSVTRPWPPFLSYYARP